MDAAHGARALSEYERDILSYVRNHPKGLPWHAMSKHQVSDLTAIIGAFAARLPAEVAAAQFRNIERHGLENLTFAWAGGTSPGGRHYFRIQGPVLLIEHDNTQADGAHIHSVWRNPRRRLRRRHPRRALPAASRQRASVTRGRIARDNRLGTEPCPAASRIASKRT